MKLKIFLVFVLIFSFRQIYSQQFYVKLHGGYGIGTSLKNYQSFNDIQISENQPSGVTGVKNYSFGEGINLSGAFGYFINSNLGCELEIQYSISSDLILQDNYSGSDFTQKGERTLSSKSFMIIPSLFISTEFSSVKPYLKIGPILAFPGITENLNINYTMQNPEATGQNFKIETETLLDGGSAIGINSSIGITYNISGNINLVFEVNNKSISYSPDKSEIKSAKQNGVTFLQQLQRDQKEIEFVDKTTSSSVTDPNKPSQQLKSQYSFSSLAFSFGISINL